ncbi:MAG: protein kinase [Deltaproteobacteria bacterium]|nr:protein kinase [Deltaproteobacteria bacterium]
MTSERKTSRRIGRYHVLDRVAAGGMAEVFRARQIDADGSESVVALKKVLEQYAADPGYIRMLKYEYRLASLLRHPNIAVIHELIRSKEGYFIVLEYVDGKDLRATQQKLWERKKPWEIADAVYLMARALDGLHFAHVATLEDGRPLNLVHRDFSPSNILLSYDGAVKLIDFGIAKAAMPRDQTAAGIIKGKVRYMSPEQANGDDRLTAQSDVFSAGTVLYELLCGEPAFTAPNELELIYTVRRAQPKPLAELAPHLPRGLVEIVRRAMMRGRKNRFASAAEFRDELVTFLRAFAPGYRRTSLTNLMKSLWATELDEEIRTLLQYVISNEEGAPAENLLESASIDESISAVSMFNDLRELRESATDLDDPPPTLPGRRATGSAPNSELPKLGSQAPASEIATQPPVHHPPAPNQPANAPGSMRPPRPRSLESVRPPSMSPPALSDPKKKPSQ